MSNPTATQSLVDAKSILLPCIGVVAVAVVAAAAAVVVDAVLLLLLMLSNLYISDKC